MLFLDLDRSIELEEAVVAVSSSIVRLVMGSFFLSNPYILTLLSYKWSAIMEISSSFFHLAYVNIAVFQHFLSCMHGVFHCCRTTGKHRRLNPVMQTVVQADLPQVERFIGRIR